MISLGLLGWPTAMAAYVPLAPLAGDSGAEWSLFWPGMGIAVDSCARVIALLERPAAGSAFVSGGDAMTAAAGGTDVLGSLPCAGLDCD
jgi:hypothetical protein